MITVININVIPWFVMTVEGQTNSCLRQRIVLDSHIDLWCGRNYSWCVNFCKPAIDWRFYTSHWEPGGIDPEIARRQLRQRQLPQFHVPWSMLKGRVPLSHFHPFSSLRAIDIPWNLTRPMEGNQQNAWIIFNMMKLLQLQYFRRGKSQLNSR